MGEEFTKEKIIKALTKHIEQLDFLRANFKFLDTTDNQGVNRVTVNNITFTLFELIDSIVNTEADIYNFMKRRG